MSMHNYKPGDRVGALMSANEKVVDFLGYGIYAGDEIPPDDIGGFNVGRPNPKIQLDNGDIVWGCECWWGDEAQMKEFCATRKVNIVSIKNMRAAAAWVAKKENPVPDEPDV